MAGKASTYWPEGIKPILGISAPGYLIGRKSRGIFTWSACPDCGSERWVGRGQKTKLCMSCAAIRRNSTGEKNHRWKGGVRQGHDGYRYITVPENHLLIAMAGRVFVHGKYHYYIAEHRLVMAQHLGRPLKKWELVHHKGTKYPSGSLEDKRDNRVENLELLAHKKEHLPSMNVQRVVSGLEKRVAILEKRITLLEAENILLKSLLEGSRDNVPDTSETETL